MSGAVQSFGFGEQLVRVVDRDGDAWFVGNDVCGALEVGNPRDALGRLDEDERDSVGIADAIGRQRDTTIISESGVFALIFTSRKPSAKAFRKWVTSEVLPAIRRHGCYALAAANDDAEPAVEPTPDALELDRLALQKVREARICFGPAAARRMWALAGLPDLSDPARPAMAALGTAARSHPLVAAWFDERVDTSADQAARVRTMTLYEDFRRWAAEQGAEPLSVRAFADGLAALGVRSVKSNGMWRVGVALRG